MNHMRHCEMVLSNKKRLIKTIYRIVVLCELMAISSIVTYRKAEAVEPKEEQWKPQIGERYRWTDPAGVKWDAVDIATSQRNAKVTFLSRQAPIEPGNERFRAILFSEGKKVMPLPYNVGRGRQDQIEVFWYEPIDKEGPFFRLVDRWGEYVVDLHRQTTALMVRRKGLTFVGELRHGEDKDSSVGISDYGNRIELSVAGRPTMVVIGPLATQEGKKMGEISDK